MAKQDEFYKQMDEYKHSKSNCSCFGLAILMLAVLILGEFILFFIARGVRSDPSGEATVSRLTPNAQFSIVESGTGNVEIVISEGVLCSKLSEIRQQDGLGCTISEEGVVITGKLATFLPANASLSVTPVLKDGKIHYDVNYLKVGNFKVFGFLAPTIAGALSKVINLEIKDVEITRIDLSEAIMIIVGKQK